MRTVVGIDLGTTNSLVALLVNGRPEVVPNHEGKLLTPSAVSIDDDGRVLVGAPALARATTHPELTTTAFKRDMGSSVVRRLGSRQFRPEELSALVLGELRRDAEQQLGRAIDEAVVTVPAYFGELQRRATRDACEIAELPVERIINEPTAAALAFGLHEVDRELTAVVLDLGGGTFDVTVLEIMEGVIEIQASAGDSQLGGDDFLDMIVGEITERIAQRWGAVEDPISVARVRQACERAKRQLTGSKAGRVALAGLVTAQGTHDVELELDRTEAEALWKPLLQRIRGPIRRALRDANQSPEAIEEVLLVGGATRMDCIADLASELFGRLPAETFPPTKPSPSEPPFKPASSQATLRSRIWSSPTSPIHHGGGDRRSARQPAHRWRLHPHPRARHRPPASRMKVVYTLTDNQREVVVEVYQGEHSNCRDNTKLGEYHVKNIPAAKRRAVPRDSLHLRSQRVLEVESTVQSTGKQKAVVFERTPGALSPKQVEQARAAMARLKFHPRESLPNRTALARPMRSTAETSGLERELLGDVIQRFRLALERQDEALISAVREELQGLVSQLRR